MKQNDKLPIKITHQGALLINDAYIHAVGKNVLAVGIDMKSKRGDVIAEGTDGECPEIFIEAIKESCHLNTTRNKMLLLTTETNQHKQNILSSLKRYPIAL